MFKIYTVLVIGFIFTNFQNSLFAQSVLDPNDTLVEYDSLNPPVQPPWGQIGKWVRTKSLSWNSDSYKAYIYEGSCFRLKFPKSYNPTANDGKKYPLALVFHGGGEAGPITDNETQLYHGGYNYMLAVDSGKFDGYVLFMQSQGSWGTTSYNRLIDIINYMIANNKLDPFRMSANGLSSGGQASWDMVLSYSKYVTASLPMSNVSITYKQSSVVNSLKFTSIWNFQGALDGSPSRSTAEQVYAAMESAGANYRYSEYPNVGHNTWDSAFAEPDFFPFMLRNYASNPWTLYGRTGFCPGDPINVTIGLPQGFDGYQWRKNDTLISGATSNYITVTSFGKYDARVLRGSTWSDWSPIPVNIQITPPTQAPPIQVSGLMSNVLESGDGKNYVNLEVPDSGYTSYTWKKVGSDSILSTQKIYTATQTGQYIVAVTKQYSCSSIYSQPFSVIKAQGINVPDAASKLTATTLSSTQIELNWENNPHPVNNESYFEIYRSTSETNGFSFVGKVASDILKFEDDNVTEGTTYYYKIRAINNNGAAAFSNIASTSSYEDNIAPTAPGELTILYTTTTSMSIRWNRSTDNVGILNYDIFINGVKSYTTTDTSFIVNALQKGQQYSFYVKAKDLSGNYSPQSNLASSPAILKGLFYKYYEGYWLSMPDFNTLIPLSSGVSSNTDLTIAKRQAQLAILWQGYLNVPQTGIYKIGTVSDDGSKVWLSTYDPNAVPLINNDHINIVKGKFVNVSLQKGIYPITIAYFQLKNGRKIQLEWANPSYFGDSLIHIVENKYFISDTTVNGTPPITPGNFNVTSTTNNSVKISWSDVSNDETGFQVYRSFRQKSGYNIIFTTQANSTSFTDTGLNENTKYYYKINAVNNFGNSDFTDPVLAKTINSYLPAAPNGLKAKSLSSSSIRVTWNDVDTTETNYQILRSVVDTTNFKPAAILPANSTSFVDSGLYGNTNYYYQVITVRSGVSSKVKPIVTTKTKNTPPVFINKFSSLSVPYGVATNLLISASDADADPVTFKAIKLPSSFASLTDNGNNTANIVFNPSSAQQGDYQDVKIIVKDSSGARDSNVFTLTVNTNFYPVVDSIADYVLNEGDSITIPLHASDQNAGDNLNWSVNNMPGNFSIVPVSNGVANLVFKPSYKSAGNYQVTVAANDGNGGIGSSQFNVTINDTDPGQTIYLRFKDQDSIGVPWNNITGVNSLNFKDKLNRNSNVGLSLQTTWWATADDGPNTGNNSGIYPDAVMNDYYYFGSSGGPQTVTGKITGLDTSKLYAISFYGASNWGGTNNNGTTIYTIGSQSIPLSVQGNITSTANFNTIKPATDGSVSFTMSKGINTTSGYINAIVVNRLFTDTLKPAAPTFLNAAEVKGSGVLLSWNDNSYNETNFNVYRSLSVNGPFVLLNGAIPLNSTRYFDTSAEGNTQYFYIVNAFNQQYQSDSSNVANIKTSDRVPVISPISSITVKNNQQQTVNVFTEDDPGDHVTLTASNLPSFVSFSDNGNGTGFFTISPSSGVTGTFDNITITATDNSDSTASTSFNITVNDQNITSVYINFSTGSIAPAPWNNFTSWPTANSTISNLTDDNNSVTPISVKLLNGFQGNFATGMQPGNNKGIYPEIVMQTGLSENRVRIDSIQVAGLDVSKKYNFVFFNSHDNGQNGTTVFTAKGRTVTLNAKHNINTTAEINGLSPNDRGQIILQVSKAIGADYAYLNSMIIESYDSALSLLAPSNLIATGLTKTSVSLQWADKDSNGTGFEIWRATDSNATYSLIQSLGATITNYTDSNLVPGQNYYYTVRAVSGTSTSAFCSPISATTYSQVVYVNFTFINNANVPWNNTMELPEPGLVWNNLYDDTGTPSSFNLQEVSSFAGLYGPGMNTGNNSGIYPDKVLMDSYGLFTGEIGTLKVSGLNVNSTYDFTFFASSQVNGDVNSVYTVNGNKGILNASLNTDGTITVYNIVPDKNGEATITITTKSNTSQYSLIGALVIQEYKPNNNIIPSPSLMHYTPIAQNEKNVQTGKPGISKIEISAYPNPFSSSLNLLVSMKTEDNVLVDLFDINGKLITRKNFGILPQGHHNLSMVTGKDIPNGVYILKIILTNSKTTSYIKLLKQ